LCRYYEDFKDEEDCFSICAGSMDCLTAEQCMERLLQLGKIKEVAPSFEKELLGDDSIDEDKGDDKINFSEEPADIKSKKEQTSKKLRRKSIGKEIDKKKKFKQKKSPKEKETRNSEQTEDAVPMVESPRKLLKRRSNHSMENDIEIFDDTDTLTLTLETLSKDENEIEEDTVWNSRGSKMPSPLVEKKIDANQVGEIAPTKKKPKKRKIEQDDPVSEVAPPMKLQRKQ